MALLAPWQAPVSRTSPGTPAVAPGLPPRREPRQAPAWWPHAHEFPRWHVWEGVTGVLYARLPRSSPPKVVRARDVATLRERMLAAVAVV